MNLPEFTTNATRAAEQLRALVEQHPEWEAVKSGDGLYYIFDRADRCRGYVTFAEGRVTLYQQEAKRGKA